MKKQNLKMLKYPVTFSEWWHYRAHAEYTNAVYDLVLYLFDDVLADKEEIEIKVIAETNFFDDAIPIIQIRYNEIEIVLKKDIVWTISVKTNTALELDFDGVFNADQNIAIDKNNCDTFLSDWIFGSYNENHCRFSFTLMVDYQVYVFFFIVFKKYLKL